MSSDITGDIIVIVILIVFSAYFSATETAFTSINKIRLKNMAGEGNKKADKVLRISEKYDKLLTTILIGNNIVNIGMTSIATVLFINLFGDYGATLATVVITIVVLIFGEITPKNIAKETPENFAMFSAPILRCFMIIMTPINFVFTKWKQLVAKVFRLESNDLITGDEILTMVEEAERCGGINQVHSELIQNAIEFYTLTAEAVMTPRPNMEAVDMNSTEEVLTKTFRRTGYSRLPVYEEDIDRIVGVLNQNDFNNFMAGNEKNIAEYMEPVVFVSTSIRISDLLKKMQQANVQMAIVIDEYGGTEGLITMEDITEELVGGIFDEHDAIASKDIMPQQDGSYRIRCSANLNKVFDYFEIDDELDVVTVNGWVISELNKLPEKGDVFESIIDDKRVKVRVTEADTRKALEINLKLIEIVEQK